MLPLLGIIFLLSVIGGIWFYRHVKPDASNTLIAILFFGPAALAWVGDKELSELGVGGVYAKFESTVKQGGGELPLAKDAPVLTPSPNKTLHGASFFGECASFLRLESHRVPTGPPAAINQYLVHATGAIGSSLTCGKLVGVVVLDEHGRYSGSFDGQYFAQATSLWMIFRSGEDGDDDATVLQQLSLQQYAHWAEMIKTRTVFGAALLSPRARISAGEGFVAFVKESDSIRYAWEELQDTRGDFLAVTDRKLEFKSILTRRTVQDIFLERIVRGPRRRPAGTRTDPLRLEPPRVHPHYHAPPDAGAAR